MIRDDAEWQVERAELVRLLERDGAIRTAAVRQAFLAVPRHHFIPPEIRPDAYQNHALPIGLGQTISQPHMVAVMTELLQPAPGKRVLEIGTGSGYQAAILARLCGQVYSIERIAALSEQAQNNLASLGYDNIVFRVDDGTLGWPEESPFDGIVVTAGAPEPPPSLLRQLADGGILVVPVGDRSYQVLVRITRHGEEFQRESHGGCIFVKLIGKEAWRE